MHIASPTRVRDLSSYINAGIPGPVADRGQGQGFSREASGCSYLPHHGHRACFPRESLLLCWSSSLCQVRLPAKNKQG